nr:GT4 family glycosyltransferase PelF [Schleiferilactobacillus shenzhenensis]
MARTAYACADEVVTLSARNQQHQLAAGAAPDRLAVIPNGVAGADYAALPRHRFSPQALQIGAIVRLTPIKDIVTLIHACDYLRQAGVPFHCTVMGPADEDPAYARRCRELIAALDLAEHITLTGKVAVADYLPRLDVLVLTSISESQPLAMLEGMAAGIPWVTTNVGDCQELLTGPGDDDGRAGFVVRPIAPDQIADKLAWFYRHPDALATMGAAGARRVLARYQLTHMVAAYTALYASA